MASLNSLMSGGWEPDIYDIESNWVPDIECQYGIEYLDEGEVEHEYFTCFEGEDESRVFNRALEFARTHDTFTFWREPDGQYFNPKTGEEVNTPANAGTDYYTQPTQPYAAQFVPCELDKLSLYDIEITRYPIIGNNLLGTK